MEIKVPKEIKMGVHPYQIRFNRYLWMEEQLQGSVNRIKQIVEIEADLPQSQRNVTLLHEVIHIINDIYSLRIDDDAIDRLAQGWAEFLFDNLGIKFNWDGISDKLEE